MDILHARVNSNHCYASWYSTCGLTTGNESKSPKFDSKELPRIWKLLKRDGLNKETEGLWKAAWLLAENENVSLMIHCAFSSKNNIYFSRRRYKKLMRMQTDSGYVRVDWQVPNFRLSVGVFLCLFILSIFSRSTTKGFSHWNFNRVSFHQNSCFHSLLKRLEWLQRCSRWTLRFSFGQIGKHK